MGEGRQQEEEEEEEDVGLGRARCFPRRPPPPWCLGAGTVPNWEPKAPPCNFFIAYRV